MPNSKIYQKISKYAGCDWSTVKSVLNAYSLFLQDEILEKHQVWLPKIGHFKLKYHGKIKIRNVAKGGSEQTMPGFYHLVFQVSPKLKRFIQDSPFLDIKL